MKKNLGFFLLREIYIPSSPKKILRSTFVFLSLFAWNLIDVALHSQIRNALVLFSICNLLGEKKKKFSQEGGEGKKNPMNVL